jgi:hypothetical protein
MHAGQQYLTTTSGPATESQPATRPTVPRIVAAPARFVSADAIYPLFLFITRSESFSSDPANNALHA